MEKTKIKFCLLGTASGIPTKNRYNESVALTVNEDVYLLDAGEPCGASLIRRGIDYTKIRAVFVSHMDADHSSGIPMLVQTMQLGKKRERPLKIFLPEGAPEQVRRYLEMMSLVEETLPFKLEFLPIKPGSVYQDELLTVVAYPNKHVESRFRLRKEILVRYPHVQRKSFSFCLTTTDNRKIVYTGDIEKMSELDAFIDGTDFLLTELAHVKPEDVFQYLSGKQVSRIVCLHIHPDWNDREKECLELSKKYLDNKVEIGRDGREIEI